MHILIKTFTFTEQMVVEQPEAADIKIAEPG